MTSRFTRAGGLRPAGDAESDVARDATWIEARAVAGDGARDAARDAARGEPIFYIDEGLSDGPPCLLIHGDLSDGAGTWEMQRSPESLAGRCRLIIVDRRGYGRSPKEPRPYTIASDAADALEAAERAGVGGRFHLLGHSYGGLVAIELARRHPDRILSLHLIEPPYMDLLPDDPDVRALRERSRGIFRSAAEREPEWIVAAFFDMLGGPSVVEALRARPEWDVAVANARRLADEQFPAEYPATVAERVRVAGPVQVYAGGRSHPALRKLAAELASRIPEARLIDIEEAGHAVQRVRSRFDPEVLSVLS